MHSNEESVETNPRRIAMKACTGLKFRFISLFHLMNEELLRGCFERLRKSAASGIDGVTKEIMVSLFRICEVVSVKSRVR